MNTFENQAAQGDILVTKIDELPTGLSPMKQEGGKYVVAHSETGHHHVVEPTDAVVYEAANDPFVLFVVPSKDTDITHLRSFHTHAPLTLKGGNVYRINRQREYTPEGFRRAAD